MNLQKSEADSLSSIIRGGRELSEGIAEITGQDKLTVTLITMGLAMATAGILRSLKG